MLIFHRNRVAIGKFSASNPLDVDHYHYISADNPRGSDTSGVAKVMGYYGWKYDGTVCWPAKKERTAITEFWGNPKDWDGGKLNAGLVILFIDNDYYRSKNDLFDDLISEYVINFLLYRFLLTS